MNLRAAIFPFSKPMKSTTYWMLSRECFQKNKGISH